jgi:hypothetical protein
MATSIVIDGERDFCALADAANAAHRAGNHGLAEQLDTLARKASVALARKSVRALPGMNPKSVRWQDVPSCILHG